MNKRTIGTEYEEKAAAFLIGKGMRLLERNFRCRIGEIDLIMQDGPCLVFVEVKFRRTDAFGEGEYHVDRAKQSTIYQVAELYLLRKGLTDPLARFDVVAIDGEGNITHIENAFEK